MAKHLTPPPLSNTQVTELCYLYETAADAKLRLRAQAASTASSEVVSPLSRLTKRPAWRPL
jgi:hypothetical protein